MTQAAERERFQTNRVIIISAGHALHDTYTTFLPPLLPAFIEKLSLSKTEAGLLSVFLQAPSLLQPAIGHLADRVNLKYFVIFAPAVSATMMSMLGIAPGYAMLALLLLIAGFSSAGFHSVAPVMAGTLSGRSLGRGMGFWMLGGELGRTLGPIVVVSVVGLVSLRGLPWLIIFGVMASAALYSMLKEAPVRPPDTGPGLPWKQALHKMKPVMAPLTGIIAVRAFMLSALIIYLPTFLTEEGASFWLAGASLSLYEAAGVAGALCGGWMSDRLGRRFVLVISMIASPLSMFVFLAVGGWIRFALLLVLGFTALSIAPVIMALVQESFPENRAFANGIYMSLSFGLRSGAVVFVGALGDSFGLSFAFLICAVIMVLGVPFVVLLPGARR
ncbi:MAG: MFS transporter [Candidatus Latescibacteria bacterium]|nr:MFS transporter [Candidatus Latescibacterota bacterium]NIO29060.1 MFS transporter [Candidatus Latescibacterota bacterium]NIO56685.1 MFS transporter [Candidatus Latescibacterota bacterium]NIT02268.1 MFS transporter [Candidatus Latescibacterota bacterium]NIT39153.1 MFS transporter [Candidatus Latescibacterota bacterium]